MSSDQKCLSRHVLANQSVPCLESAGNLAGDMCSAAFFLVGDCDFRSEHNSVEDGGLREPIWRLAAMSSVPSMVDLASLLIS